VLGKTKAASIEKPYVPFVWNIIEVVELPTLTQKCSQHTTLNNMQTLIKRLSPRQVLICMIVWMRYYMWSKSYISCMKIASMLLYYSEGNKSYEISYISFIQLEEEKLLRYTKNSENTVDFLLRLSSFWQLHFSHVEHHHQWWFIIIDQEGFLVSWKYCWLPPSSFFFFVTTLCSLIYHHMKRIYVEMGLSYSVLKLKMCDTVSKRTTSMEKCVEGMMLLPYSFTKKEPFQTC